MSDPTIKRGWRPEVVSATDCELLALGHFLHEKGLLETAGIEEINGILGRLPGELDVKAFSFKLMLGLGCDRITVFDAPLVIDAVPFEEWLELEREYNDPRATDSSTSRKLYESTSAGIRAIGAVYREHPDRFIHEQRPVTASDIDQYVADERNIFSGEFFGPGSYGAICGMNQDGRYRAFNMWTGRYEAGPSAFRRGLTSEFGLLGWRLPA